MADFNADGNLDLISGCFEGGAYLLMGRAGGGFDEPAALLDREGAILRVGQYWDYDAKQWTGVETSAHKEFLGISVFAVDWDADGDLDLLLGTNQGRMFLRINEGCATKAAFASRSAEILAAGKPIEVPSAHALPVAADWDGDGLFDLLTGSGDGAVYWYRNVGKSGKPAFAAGAVLVKAKSGEGPGLGQRTQVTVADFDGDGSTDLLIGDFRSSSEGGKHSFQGFVWVALRQARVQ